MSSKGFYKGASSKKHFQIKETKSQRKITSKDYLMNSPHLKTVQSYSKVYNSQGFIGSPDKQKDFAQVHQSIVLKSKLASGSSLLKINLIKQLTASMSEQRRMQKRERKIELSQNFLAQQNQNQNQIKNNVEIISFKKAKLIDLVQIHQSVTNNMLQQISKEQNIKSKYIQQTHQLQSQKKVILEQIENKNELELQIKGLAIECKDFSGQLMSLHQIKEQKIKNRQQATLEHLQFMIKASAKSAKLQVQNLIQQLTQFIENAKSLKIDLTSVQSNNAILNSNQMRMLSQFSVESRQKSWQIIKMFQKFVPYANPWETDGELFENENILKLRETNKNLNLKIKALAEALIEKERSLQKMTSYKIK